MKKKSRQEKGCLNASSENYIYKCVCDDLSDVVSDVI